MTITYKNPRLLSVLAFSFSSAYLLSFLFEGQVLYHFLGGSGLHTSLYILAPILAHFVGLLSAGFLIKSSWKIKHLMLTSTLACLISSIAFFFPPSIFWLVALIMAGYASGCSVAAWGYFLKAFTPKNERILSCADVLILSNILMIIINVIAINQSSLMGLGLAMLCLLIGAVFTWMLPDDPALGPTQNRRLGSKDLKRPMLTLSLFIIVITITSGLMYQVINPSFQHLSGLRSWYWSVPYISTLALMRHFPRKTKRPVFLSIGMGMIIGAFILFMLLGRSSLDYILINTLMLSACAIFDLFWWSIIGEMLEYTHNPIKLFGLGLSANVLGILLGGLMGWAITSSGLPNAEVTVIALTIVSITLIILPPLNNQLTALLQDSAYPMVYEEIMVEEVEMIDPLTKREQEVLQLILSGKSNKQISADLSITESTVKTHVRNIYSKHGVASRAELMSSFLKKSN